ncbi:MAG: ThuA domain-containing protein [Tangfeifania sp.]
MKTKLFFLFTVVICFTFSCAAQNDTEYKEPLQVLIFSKTNGFRHASISSGLKMLSDLSPGQNWVITATEDSTLFEKDILDNYDVAVFLNPTGDAIDEPGEKAFEEFMKSGKGFVGIHAAADFEYEWPFYGNLVGGYFKTHPPAQEGTVVFEDYNHPAMEPFKGMESYTTFDEWYTFKENPRPNVNVLASLDESSVKKAKNDDWKMGDHPLIWWNEENGMRSFYTVFGHTHEAFQDELIIEHIKNAINWAGKRLN